MWYYSSLRMLAFRLFGRLSHILLLKYQKANEIEKFFAKMKAKYLNVTQHLLNEMEMSVSSANTLNETQCNELEHEMSLCIAQLTRLLQQLTTTLGSLFLSLSL
jgi:tRNA A37 threonylcarbamoyltransferase TsaD